MKNSNIIFKRSLLAAMVAIGSVQLAACEAEGDPSEAGGIIGGSSSGGVSSSGGTSGGGTGVPNDGSTPTTVTEGGTAISGNFICTAGAKAYGPSPVTSVTANGLVGGAITQLLALLGGDTLTQLLNSVKDQSLAVDGNLDTAATYSLTLGLLGGLISSIDFAIQPNSSVPAGKYAVFALSFPTATLELSLLQNIEIDTYLNDTAQESATTDATTLDLLGQVSLTDPYRFVGMKVTKPYNKVTVTLNPQLLSVNVGDAMRVHELCTDGTFVAAP